MFLRKFKENVLKGRKYHSFHRNSSCQLLYVMFGSAGTLMDWLVNVSCGMNINLGLHLPRNLCDAIFHWCRWLGTSMSRYFLVKLFFLVHKSFHFFQFRVTLFYLCVQLISFLFQAILTGCAKLVKFCVCIPNLCKSKISETLHFPAAAAKNS